jgi:hypothetical protein
MTITHVVRGTGALETPLKENEEVILSGSLVDDHVRVDPLTTFRIENGHVMMNAKLDDVPAASLPLPEFAARVNGHP